MPEVETWTFNAIRSSGQRVRRLGINFGAPGDRKDADGTLWLDFPSVGGPSPDVPLTITGDALEFVREHSALVASDQLPWVFASGVRGARHVSIRLASRDESGDAEAHYQVRLYWRDVSAGEVQSAVQEIRLQGQSTNGQIRALPGRRPAGSHPEAALSESAFIVQEWHNVTVREFLELDIPPIPATPAATSRPLLCGIDMVLE